MSCVVLYTCTCVVTITHVSCMSYHIHICASITDSMHTCIMCVIWYAHVSYARHIIHVHMCCQYCTQNAHTSCVLYSMHTSHMHVISYTRTCVVSIVHSMHTHVVCVMWYAHVSYTYYIHAHVSLVLHTRVLMWYAHVSYACHRIHAHVSSVSHTVCMHSDVRG